MVYRGQDLDLRTGRSGAHRPAGQGEASESYNGGPRQGTIAVDETLLATCNHAYDAAVFNGSREVRLEHLVYALARVGAAAQILDELGIRPETLRREAALAIAAEVPSAAADARNEPVSSEEFATTLRRASERGAERGALGGVVDLLRVIVTGSRDDATVALLSRATSDPGKLERWREDALRREPSITQVLRAAHMPDSTAAVLARIETLETTLHRLAYDSSAERRSTADLVSQVQNAVATLNASHATQPVHDRTEEVKTAIDTRVHDLSELVLSLDERLAALGHHAGTEPPEDIRTRFDRLEQRLHEQGSEISKAVTPALSERLSQLMTERFAEAGSTHWPVPALGSDTPSAMVEKLGNVELAVRSHLQGAEEQSKTHERDLHEIYEALVKLGSNQQTLANNLNTWRLDTSGDVSIVSNRLERLETTVLESLGRISAELQMLRPTHPAMEPRATASAPIVDTTAPTKLSFKRWLFGTNTVLSPTWERKGHGPVRKALTRLRLVRRSPQD